MRASLAAAAVAVLLLAAVATLGGDPPAPERPGAALPPAESAFTRAAGRSHDLALETPLAVSAARGELSDQVLSARGASAATLRAELARAARLGVVTRRGRALADACLRRPRACRERALRWELGVGSFRHQRP